MSLVITYIFSEYSRFYTLFFLLPSLHHTLCDYFLRCLDECLFIELLGMLCFLFCVSATLTRLLARIIRCITCGLTYTCAHTYTHMRIRTYIHSHIYLPILARSNTYTYTWAYIYITTNTNTHIYITDTHMYLLIVQIEVDINALRDSKSWSRSYFLSLIYIHDVFLYLPLSLCVVCVYVTLHPILYYIQYIFNIL